MARALRCVAIRPDQDDWLREHGKEFNLSEKVREMLDGYIREKKE